jgi:hypothetical protein
MIITKEIRQDLNGGITGRQIRNERSAQASSKELKELMKR